MWVLAGRAANADSVDAPGDDEVDEPVERIEIHPAVLAERSGQSGEQTPEMCHVTLSRSTNKIAAASRNSAAAMYTSDASAIAAPRLSCVATIPMTSGAVPPPASQPTAFIAPAAVPRASGRTT